MSSRAYCLYKLGDLFSDEYLCTDSRKHNSMKAILAQDPYVRDLMGWRTIHINSPPLLPPPVLWLIPSIPGWTRCMVFMMVPPLTGSVKVAAVWRPTDGEGYRGQNLAAPLSQDIKVGQSVPWTISNSTFWGLTDWKYIYTHVPSYIAASEWVTVRKWHKWVGVKPARALVVIRAADWECTCRCVFLTLALEERLSQWLQGRKVNVSV